MEHLESAVTTPITRTRDLTKAGFSSSEAARRARVEGLHRIRDGSFAPKDDWENYSAREKHATLIRESGHRLGSHTVISHSSAAVLWNLPLLGGLDHKVNVTVEHRGGGHRSKYLKYRTTRRVPDPHIVDGLAVTSPARTVVDLARTRGFTAGLVAADAALHSGLCTGADLAQQSENSQGTPRARIAALVAEYADQRSESPAESLSRARFLYLGAPLPALQQSFYDGQEFLGRVDCWWEGPRIVGECDGLQKYGVGNHMAPEEASRVIANEKIREDRIREHVDGFFRWIWNDAWRITPLEDKLVRHGLLDPSTPRQPLFL